MKNLTTVLVMAVICLFGITGCLNENSSDSVQRKQQETMLQEATAQTGMPAIKNFWERKQLKHILELRDQEGYVTYTYLENIMPVVVPGKTSLGGKLTFFGQTIGYGIPYATQYTNPQKTITYQGIATMPQADPNGLFSPSSAEATWLIMKNPNGPDAQVVYCESRVVTLPYKLPVD